MRILFLYLLFPATSLAGQFSNGACIQHKYENSIIYAVSGMNQEQSRYLLTVIDGDRYRRPVSILMDYPQHSSTVFVDVMFQEIDCNWSKNSTKYSYSDDWADPYRNVRETGFATVGRQYFK